VHTNKCTHAFCEHTHTLWQITVIVAAATAVVMVVVVVVVVSIGVHHHHCHYIAINQPYGGNCVGWTDGFAISEEVSLN
jgi:hypothetical protein